MPRRGILAVLGEGGKSLCGEINPAPCATVGVFSSCGVAASTRFAVPEKSGFPSHCPLRKGCGEGLLRVRLACP